MSVEIKFNTAIQVTPGCVATMPRSGTWWTFRLFDAIDMLLTGRKDFKASHYFEAYTSYGIAKLHVHACYPWLDDIANYPPIRRQATQLFSTPGYNYGMAHILNHQLYTQTERSLHHYLYIFRNPFDQIVSFFDHGQNHKDPTVLQVNLPNGAKHVCTSADDYAQRAGIVNYFKQFTTWLAAVARPDRSVKFVRYEDLKTNTPSCLDECLDFLGARIHPKIRSTVIEEAVELASIKRLKEDETRKGGAIGGDQLGTAGTHSRGGG